MKKDTKLPFSCEQLLAIHVVFERRAADKLRWAALETTDSTGKALFEKMAEEDMEIACLAKEASHNA